MSSPENVPEVAAQGSDWHAPHFQISSAFEAFGTGPLAELRRMTHESPPGPAFWRLMSKHPEVLSRAAATQDERERRWAALLSARAFLQGFSRGEPLGKALALAGFSELRFTRLLRAQEDNLLLEVRRVAQFLSVKAQAANWIDLVDLVLSQGRAPYEENVRRRIARDYFRNLENNA
jgi:CRISPR system Cascade subunit CasB